MCELLSKVLTLHPAPTAIHYSLRRAHCRAPSATAVHLRVPFHRARSHRGQEGVGYPGTARMTDHGDATQEVLRTWDRVAPGWERHRARLFESFRAASDWLVDAIDPSPGQTILELAC